MDLAGERKKDTRFGKIINNGFFPDVEIADFCEQYRIPAELSLAIVRNQLELAMIEVFNQLKHLISADAKLADFYPNIGEKNSGEILYFRAIFCEAKAELMRESGTMLMRKDAKNELKTSETTEDKYREFSDDAVRKLCGAGRITSAIV